jgi:hypothetical protein
MKCSNPQCPNLPLYEESLALALFQGDSRVPTVKWEYCSFACMATHFNPMLAEEVQREEDFKEVKDEVEIKQSGTTVITGHTR